MESYIFVSPAHVVFTQTLVRFVWKKLKANYFCSGPSRFHADLSRICVQNEKQHVFVPAQVVFTQTLVRSVCKWKAICFPGPSHFQTDLSKICVKMESHFFFPGPSGFHTDLNKICVERWKLTIYVPAQVFFTQTLVRSVWKWKAKCFFSRPTSWSHRP